MNQVLDQHDFDGFVQGLRERFDADEAADVAVFWGEGGAFCAGWDLKTVSDLDLNDPVGALDFPEDGGKAPRGPLKLDAYDNPIQNVYISKIQKVKHPVLGDVLTEVPVKTYENVSQFWKWKPEEFLKHGPYKR